MPVIYDNVSNSTTSNTRRHWAISVTDIIISGIEASTGAACLVVTRGVGAHLGCSLVFAHGIDSIYSNVRDLLLGYNGNTLTHQVFTPVLGEMGADIADILCGRGLLMRGQDALVQYAGALVDAHDTMDVASQLWREISTRYATDIRRFCFENPSRHLHAAPLHLAALIPGSERTTVPPPTLPAPATHTTQQTLPTIPPASLQPIAPLPTTIHEAFRAQQPVPLSQLFSTLPQQTTAAPRPRPLGPVDLALTGGGLTLTVTGPWALVVVGGFFAIRALLDSRETHVQEHIGCIIANFAEHNYKVYGFKSHNGSDVWQNDSGPGWFGCVSLRDVSTPGTLVSIQLIPNQRYLIQATGHANPGVTAYLYVGSGDKNLVWNDIPLPDCSHHGTIAVEFTTPTTSSPTYDARVGVLFSGPKERYIFRLDDFVVIPIDYPHETFRGKPVQTISTSSSFFSSPRVSDTSPDAKPSATLR